MDDLTLEVLIQHNPNERLLGIGLMMAPLARRTFHNVTCCIHAKCAQDMLQFAYTCSDEDALRASLHVVGDRPVDKHEPCWWCNELWG